MRVGDEEVYDMILLKDITVKYYSYISEGVSPPPCVVVARSHTAAKNPDLEPVVPANCGYVPRRLQIKLQDYRTMALLLDALDALELKEDDEDRTLKHAGSDSKALLMMIVRQELKTGCRNT